MILTDDEFEELQNMEFSQNDWLWFYTQAVENKLLEKLKAQEPDKWTPAGFCDDGEPLYRHPLPPDDVVRDAERYRWLRDTLSKSVGGGVEVNDAALVYEESEQGEEVHVYWYPDTPIGFYEIKAKTLDAAIDAAMKEMK